MANGDNEGKRPTHKLKMYARNHGRDKRQNYIADVWLNEDDGSLGVVFKPGVCITGEMDDKWLFKIWPNDKPVTKRKRRD